MIRDFLYTPIKTVKPVADEVWIVDGPEIRFGMGPFNMSFPTRMTLIRLPGGPLVIHSPTALTPDLAQEVKVLGEVADIVAPNKIHYWWVRDMRMTFRGREDHLRQAVRRMMDWKPERILLTHGMCYEANCRKELARAFRFVNVGD